MSEVQRFHALESHRLPPDAEHVVVLVSPDADVIPEVGDLCLIPDYGEFPIERVVSVGGAGWCCVLGIPKARWLFREGEGEAFVVGSMAELQVLLPELAGVAPDRAEIEHACARLEGASVIAWQPGVREIGLVLDTVLSVAVAADGSRAVIALGCRRLGEREGF